MAKLFANIGDSDQMPHLCCLIWVDTVCQLPFLGSPEHNRWTNDQDIHTPDKVLFSVEK